MARKRRGESVGGYFKRVFGEHPEWLELSDNAQVVERWKQDHGKTEMPKSVRANMANIKSKMRSAARGGAPAKGGRRKGRRTAAVAPRAAVGRVEQLELMIDNCLAAAREMNVQNIDDVIRPLRRARNNIVLIFDTKA
jgi:hypothetical protein